MARSASVYCSPCGTPFGESKIVTLAEAPVGTACKPALLRRLQEGMMVATRT